MYELCEPQPVWRVMQKQTKTWLHGVIAAFIGGLAGAIDSGIALMIVVPKDFNLGPDLKKTLLTRRPYRHQGCLCVFEAITIAN